jgi:hypothetical protein
MKIRNRLRATVAVAGVLAALVSFGPSANAVGIPQGPYEIFNDNHGPRMCLDVPYGSKDNGVKVQLIGCWAGKMQLWYAEFTAYGPPGENAYFRWRNVASNKCLDVFGGDPTNGLAIQQWDCWADQNAGQMQQWQSVSMDPNSFHVMLKNRQTHKCIDIPWDNQTPGVLLQQWDCWGGTMQTWREDWP